jgi:hypothetical protein
MRSCVAAGVGRKRILTQTLLKTMSVKYRSKEAGTVSTIIWPQKSLSSVGYLNFGIPIKDTLENLEYTQFDLKIALCKILGDIKMKLPIKIAKMLISMKNM